MSESEIWKQIEDYENYEVSNLGNVRNNKTNRVLKAYNRGGYYCVGLSKKSKLKTYNVHRLVAQTFIQNIDNNPQVNHKDKNSLNNNVNNLEWVTNKENSIHRSNGVTQTTNQNLEIYRIDPITNDILEKYNSIVDAANWVISQNLTTNFNSVSSSISCSVRGIYKSSFGFKWEKIKNKNLDNEEWREVVIDNQKIEDYCVSTLGRFKNKKNVIMGDYKPHHTGYIYVRVNSNKYALHRLVAQTFINNLENKPFVNHIDGNKTNNSSCNLEWVTCSENNLHNHKVGLTKGNKRKIIQYDSEMNEIKTFDAIKEASKELSICYSSIKAVLCKKQNKAGGFIFKYLD
jgi:hypothetical protein